MGVVNMIEKEMVLMNVMRTENNFDITEEQILNSLNSFINKPVVLNKNQEMKDYRCKDLKQLNKERAIGLIKTAKYDQNAKQVIGIVQIYKDEDCYNYFKPKYDNWQITFENNVEDNKFEFNAVEFFLNKVI